MLKMVAANFRLHLEALNCMYAKSESIVVFEIMFPIGMVLIQGQKSALVMRKLIKYGS